MEKRKAAARSATREEEEVGSQQPGARDSDTESDDDNDLVLELLAQNECGADDGVGHNT
jgi:hypothetical protein